MSTFTVEKRDKRLFIVEVETGERVYSPPSFLRVPNRAVVHDLARAFSINGNRDILSIIQFETRHSPRRVPNFADFG